MEIWISVAHKARHTRTDDEEKNEKLSHMIPEKRLRPQGCAGVVGGREGRGGLSTRGIGGQYAGDRWGGGGWEGKLTFSKVQHLALLYPK